MYITLHLFPQAAELVVLNIEQYQDQMRVVRDYLEDSLQVGFTQTQFCGH